MEPAVWALVGLLAATILGNTFYLGSRIDAQAARIDVLFGLMADLKEDMAGFRADVRSGFAEVRSDLADLRSVVETHLERHAG